MGLLVASYSYCYSDTTYGVTGNAAIAGNSWATQGILPDGSSPYITVEVMGLAYRYTMVKDPETDAIVWVRNEDLIDGGYVFEESDNWSQKPGGTIQRYFRFPYSDSARWGQGSIDVEGEGSVEDVIVTYNYKVEIDERAQLCGTSPLADPSCPGFAAALAAHLAKLKEMDPEDPYYDEWVQLQLNREAELKEEDKKEKEEPEEQLSNFEKALGGENTIEQLSTNQGAIMAELAQLPKIESYYLINIPGGEYKESVTLRGGELEDNSRALRNLANDANHRDMVRSQYDR